MAKDWSRYKVKKPEAYDAYPLSPAEGEVSEIAHQLRREMVSNPPEAKPKRAVWVVHGMGQQVPFATLEQLANGLCMAANAAQIAVSDPQFREVEIGKTVLQRVELTFAVKDAAPQEVDLYECYWAPKTEGAVKLKDVIGFLWDGGSRGLINCVSTFQRALFGTMVPYKLRRRTPAYLLLTLALLAALMVINAIILATGATLTGIGHLPQPGLVMPLTVVAELVSAMAITFGVVLFIAEISRPTRAAPRWGRTIRDATWIGILVTSAAILAGAGLMALILWAKWVPSWLRPETAGYLQAPTELLICASLVLAVLSRMSRRNRTSKSCSPESHFTRVLFYLAFAVHLAVIVGAVFVAAAVFRGNFGSSPAHELLTWLRSVWAQALALVLGGKWGGWLDRSLVKVFCSNVWVWPFLVLVSAVVRKVMVEYVGDVTAYVASNKIDRFDALRTKIKELAKGSLSAVYAAKSKGSQQFEYEKVAIIGHSLGSVIAYDTLNWLIADDALQGEPASVVERTRVLLTFGSPLDKTAFFFSVMGKTTRHIREQLAAVVQPLIEDPTCREHIPWVNVYSRNDIISGSLEFYDFPETLPPGVTPIPVKRICNVKDEDALVPLVAHVEYWENLTVWRELLKKVLDLP
jgi:hypothetical protein